MLKEFDTLMKTRIEEIFTSFFEVSVQGIEVFYGTQGSGVYTGKLFVQKKAIYFQIFYGQSNYVFELTLDDKLLNRYGLKKSYQSNHSFIDEIGVLSKFSFDEEYISIGKFRNQFRASFNYDKVHDLSHSLISEVSFFTLYPDMSEFREKVFSLSVESEKFVLEELFNEQKKFSFSLDAEGVDAFYKQFFISALTFINQTDFYYMRDMPSLDEINLMSRQEIEDLIKRKPLFIICLPYKEDHMTTLLEKQAKDFIEHICLTAPLSLSVRKEKGNTGYLYSCSARVNLSDDVRFTIHDIDKRTLFVANLYRFNDISEEDIHGLDTNVNCVLIHSTKLINPLLAYIEEQFNKNAQSLLYVKYQSFNTEFCRAQSDEGYTDVYSCITELLPVSKFSLNQKADNYTVFPYHSVSLNGDDFTIPEEYINYMNYDTIDGEDKRTLSYTDHNIASFADALYRFYVVTLARKSKKYSQCDLDLLIQEVNALSGLMLIDYAHKRITIEEMTAI